MVSLKIEKPIGLAFWLFLSGYSEFLNVNDMTVVYPNGIIDIIPWENGNVDKKNIRKHYHRSGNRISDHNFSAWKTVRRIPMKTRFYILGGKN